MAIKDDNCSAQIWYGVMPQGNPDISGIGVILAFIISAYITIAAVILAYVCGFVEDELLCPIDRRIFFIRPYTCKHPRVHEAVRHAVLALGDQQIVTGVAIMAAGFQGLRMGWISTYHFQIVLYLAWMSSSVHLSALTLLGSFLHRHKGLMVWRLSGMLVLLILLLVGLTTTLSNSWGNLFPANIWHEDLSRLLNNLDDLSTSGWGVPAICFWGQFYDDGVSPDAVLGLVLILVSYVWKVGAMMDTPRTAFKQWIRYPIENLMVGILTLPARSYARTGHGSSLWYFRLFLGLALPVFMLMEFVASFAASLWLSVLGLIFGTLEVLEPRSQAAIFTSSQESEWGFGQLVPLILLIQPLGAVAEYLWEPKEQQSRRNSVVDLSLSKPPSEAFNKMETPLPVLIEFAAGTSSWGLSLRERNQLKDILYDSKTFVGLVYLLQIGIFAASCYSLYVDADTIGLVTTINWLLVLVSIPVGAGAAILFSLIVLPFSRLGRPRPAACADGSIDTSENGTETPEVGEKCNTRRYSLLRG